MTRDIFSKNPRFLEIMRLVQQEIDRIQADTSHQDVAILAEKQSLESQCQGWLMSLGVPTLPPAVRSALETQYEQAQARMKVIMASLAERSARNHQQRTVLDPNSVADGLVQLGEILAGENASAANVMLSQHIEGIYCDQEGQVVIRTCKLGALAGAIDLVPRDHVESPEPRVSSVGEAYLAKPRRRGRLNIGAAIEDDDLAASVNEFAVDPYRFAGLASDWFNEDVFQVPRRLSWAEAHAEEVAAFRLETHQSMEVTAKHFGKTIPTIRESLRYAKKNLGIDAFGKNVSRPTRANWSRANAAAVADYFEEPGATMKGAVLKFAKSEPTIRKAQEIGRRSSRDTPPDCSSETTDTESS